MIVAGIAMQFVKETTFDSVVELIDLLAPWYPTSPEVMPAACWADDLKDVEVRTRCFVGTPIACILSDPWLLYTAECPRVRRLALRPHARRSSAV
jgi:hypothetical protein